MAQKMKKALAGAAGLLALQNGFAGLTPAMAADLAASDKIPSFSDTAAAARTLDTAAIDGVTIEKTEETTYDTIANVSGQFTYDQTILSPSDQVFSLFGTAATAACAAPGFTFEDMDEGDTAEYYINVGGKLQKAMKLSLDDLKGQGITDTMKCSCAMSPSIVNAEVTGVALSNILQLAELENDVNAVVVKGSDGYGVSLSLEQAGKAMLVYNVGGEGLQPANGGPVQLWMPGAAANYFTRQVTDIEVTAQADAAAPAVPAASQRAKINILNQFEETAFQAGSQITFEGYADDYDVAVSAIEFSLDSGQTWTSYETPEATTERWVYWFFTYDASAPGHYRLDVRCRTADGKVSPLASSIEFTVDAE